MNAKELVRQASVKIESIVKHGKRADYFITTANSTAFKLNMGSGHQSLSSNSAILPEGYKRANNLITGSITPDNMRFSLTDEEIYTILKLN